MRNLKSVDSKEELEERIFKTKQPKEVNGCQFIQALKHGTDVFIPNRVIFDVLTSVYNKDFAMKAFDEYFYRADNVNITEVRLQETG